MSNDIFDELKRRINIADVVERFHERPKDNFVSCPFHREKTPSLSIERENNYFSCFGCGEKGDMIHFVAALHKVTEYEAVKLIAESFGLSELVSHGSKRVGSLTNGNGTKPRGTFVSPITQAEGRGEQVKKVSAEVSAHHSELIRGWASKVDAKRGYLKSRGFTDDTIAKFLLGYDPVEDGIVIPYPPEFEYKIVRKFHPQDPSKPYRKPKKEEWGSEPIFNIQAVSEGGAVFVVESQLCAISIMQCGGAAVALGGLNGIDLFLREVVARKSASVFVVALDNDKMGVAMQPKLVEGLKKAGARFVEYNVSGECKDPNELLQKNAEALTINIQSATAAAEKAPERQPEKPKAADREAKVKALLGREITDPKAVFTDEYIDALAYAKAQLAADYSLFKIKAKAAKVQMRDLDNTVNQHIRKNKPQETSTERPLDLGRDLSGAAAPKGWTVTLENGVRKLVVTRDSEHEIVACPDAVVTTARLVNLDDGKERLELSFFKDGRWKRVVGMRTQVYNKNSIIAFGDEGLHVTSESAKDLVAYLSEYEIANKAVIPLKKSIARVGWVRQAEFFPYSTEEEIVFEEGYGAYIYHSLKEQGDYGVWKEMMTKLRKNPFARFLTSASFASPLLVRMGIRPFAIHIWAGSQSGKSAALKAAMSVWGDPNRLMTTACATIVGLEQKAGALNHLPFGIDEKQAADENKMPFSRLIYMLGEGEGKTRGARGGGNQEKVTWHNAAIITGEEPITSATTRDGVQTRTLELNGVPVGDKEFGQEVHILSENNFGHAGAQFMKAVCERLKTEPEFLFTKYAEVKETLKAKGIKGVHADYIAAVIIADILTETLIFGTDAETAEREAFENGEYIFKNNAEQHHGDNVENAYSFVVGWLASNDSRFVKGTTVPFTTPCYGRIEDNNEYKTTYLVVPIYVEEALKERGYNVEQVTRGFADKRYLYVWTDAGKKRRKKVTTTLNGVRMELYRFDLTKKDKPPQQIGIKDLKPINDGENLPF